MRYAPPYAADRFPADFILSVLTGLAAAAVVGPLTRWLALQYVLRTYPGHPEMRSTAIVAGVLDGLLSVVLVAGLTIALRLWIFERRERRQSDELLRDALNEIETDAKHERGRDGEPPPLPRF